MEGDVWDSTWRDVAKRLQVHREHGRAHLLTEDVLRHETVLALTDRGVEPSRLALEFAAPALLGGKVDLVLDPPDGTLIELKFPRGSRTGISPDTMTMGELVRDFVRISVLGGGWVVQVLENRLHRYLAGAELRYGLQWISQEGESLTLTPNVLAALPLTATKAIGALGQDREIVARCRVAERIDEDLLLLAYQIAKPEPAEPEIFTTSSPRSRPTIPAGAPDRPATPAREGARREILESIRRIVAHRGRQEFSIAEVVDDMKRRGTGYETSTIRTMLSSHMCAEARGEGIAPYVDVTRVGRGTYRLNASRAPVAKT